jgi:hypothetical protein
MNKQEFVNYVKNLKGAKFITIVLETIPTMNRSGIVNGMNVTNPYYGKVKKQSVINGMINFDYQAGVRRKQDKMYGTPGTSTFTVGKHPWSTSNSKIQVQGNNSVFEKGGETYLKFRPIKNISIKYFDNSGNEIPKEKIEPFLVKKTVAADKIPIISPKLSNIKKIVFKQMGHIFERINRTWNLTENKKKK